MRYALVLISVVGLVALVNGTQVSLQSQQTIVEAKSRQDAIIGVWTQIWYENEGKVHSSLPEVDPNPNAPGPNCATAWEISKQGIEVGPEDRGFPRRKLTYAMDPDDKAGILDIFQLGGKAKVQKLKLPAIYDLKGDILTICVNVDETGKRPEKFTTTGEAKTIWLLTLRRGKLQWSGRSKPIPPF